MLGILPILVLPISFCSLIRTIQSAVQTNNWRSMIPLITTQLISVYIWTCQACLFIGYYRLVTSGESQIHGSIFRNYFLATIMSTALDIDAVNVFLYTWQLIPTLKIEETNSYLARIYKYYYKFSIWTIPFGFLVLYVSNSVLEGKYYSLIQDPQKQSEAD